MTAQQRRFKTQMLERMRASLAEHSPPPHMVALYTRATERLQHELSGDRPMTPSPFQSIEQSTHALFRSGGRPTPEQQAAAQRMIDARGLGPAIERIEAQIARAFGGRS